MSILRSEDDDQGISQFKVARGFSSTPGSVCFAVDARRRFGYHEPQLLFIGGSQ